MKQVIVELKAAKYDGSLYVHKLTNTIEFEIGEKLSEQQVQNLIEREDHKTVISR